MTKTFIALLALSTAVSPAFAAGVTVKSASPRLAAEFKATDTNHDGVLSRSEVAARVARMSVGKGANGPQQTQALTDLWFSRADADHNGKVTLPEMEKLMIATAARYDTNHDGIVSREEQRAAQARMLAETSPAPKSSPKGR